MTTLRFLFLGFLSGCIAPASSGGDGDSATDGGDSDSDVDVDADTDGDTDTDSCLAADADGDGHDAAACGGDDCDDADSARHPGAPDAPRTVDVIAEAAYSPALVVDADDVVHALYDHHWDSPRHAWWEGGEWRAEDIGGALAGAEAELVYSDGALHAIVMDESLYHATNASGAWELELLSYDARYSSHTAIAVDGDALHIATFRPYFPLQVTTLEDGSSTTESLGDEQAWCRSAIAVDPDGVAHVIWGAYGLMYASNASGDWTWEAVPAGGRGEGSSMQVDADGALHVATADAAGLDDRTDDRLLYLTLPAGGEWAVEEVDVDMYWERGRLMAGERPSLGLGPDGRVHVAYHDATHADLVWAVRGPEGGWTKTVLYDEGATGYEPSLAIDSAGVVHVAFVDDASLEVRRISFQPDGVDDDCDGTADEG